MIHGFKEWTLICDALGRGDQSIILRKGGIAEGRAGFRFQHEEFLLFPTLFHEQVAKLKLPQDTPLPAPRADGQHEITYHAKVEWTQDVEDWAILEKIAPLHRWQRSEIEKRYLQDDKRMVSLAFLRISRLSEPFVFPDSPRYGGCRSWIQLPELPAHITLQPVLDEAVHWSRQWELKAILAEGTNGFTAASIPA